MTLGDIQRAIEATNLDAIAGEVVEDNKDNILQLNRDQLMSGFDSNGEKMEPQYASRDYALKKNKMNALPGLGTPDLYLTGKFQSSLQLQVMGKDVKFSDTDDKAKYLEVNYGPDNIYGLSEDSIGEARTEFLQQGLVEKMAASLNMKTA